MKHPLPGHLSSRLGATALLPFLANMGGPSRVVGRRTRPLDWNKPHQGKQEMARRRRQIERGQLTKSNGLVS
jgi:hypothetical protein